ncbi:hypothetical protein MRB53_003475 [Persea americana]|uniref:Uncharacterized protein n=1 Tax=Persea americana TaxID=3435 RepID=A0ACC2MXF5_PERAE|nr:hypothetical protein MRB53_003475 [Persea americana]
MWSCIRPEEKVYGNLDSGCSKHMCGDQTMFNELDEKFRHSVKLGNNTKMGVMGKGSVQLLLNGVNHVVAESQAPSQVQSDQCFNTRTQNLFHLWHRRYGHLSYKGLRTLLYKNMVRGLPQLSASSVTCTVCINGKQHRDPIPKKSTWRATQKLELIHAYICGPITPTSNSNKSEESKGYRLFDPVAKRVVVRGDVIFEEEKQWDWDVSYEKQIVVDLEWGDGDGENEEGVSENGNGENTDGEVGETRDEGVREEEDGSSEGEERVRELRQSGERHPPTWMGDYVSGEGLFEDEVHMALVVSTDSLYMAKPMEIHLQAAKRALRYLKGTVNYGIHYKKGGDGELLAFTDSDYAGNMDDRKSTSGYMFLMSSSAVSWCSKKQPIVTLSTTEAEFVAAAVCACQGVWMKRILKELGHSDGGCTTVMCDNSSTIKLSKNPVMHGRSKHIEVRSKFPTPIRVAVTSQPQSISLIKTQLFRQPISAIHSSGTIPSPCMAHPDRPNSHSENHNPQIPDANPFRLPSLTQKQYILREKEDRKAEKKKKKKKKKKKGRGKKSVPCTEDGHHRCIFSVEPSPSSCIKSSRASSLSTFHLLAQTKGKQKRLHQTLGTTHVRRQIPIWAISCVESDPFSFSVVCSTRADLYFSWTYRFDPTL